MGGDYTRFTFKPRRDHAGVLMQQGRVQLDSDWNEWVEMIDRRLLAETLDLVGRRCGVPRTTPHGFRIGRDADDRLEIGRGRIYVDGILVENHGTGDPEIEPVWREVRGEHRIPYREQPYLRPPTPPTEPDGLGPHLVYLDVWRREVTAVEEPEMVERALGVDTTTRMQTAWAVRCLPNLDERARCGMDFSRLDDWVEATRPSGARLTTGTPDPPDEPDPCLIQPTGGYRGIENRLYRVEIHDDGTEAGLPISFKWSHDNGSVAATIGSIADQGTKPRLTVNRLGRDAILRFHDLEWVELTDDQREAEGRPGIMARVERADDATSTITLVSALTELPDMARNPRVRRWDQTADQVNARGVIPLEPLPTEVELEDGVRVRFTLDGADPPHVGDYWVFAARAADGSVEQLEEALPRGVRHHYCPLAVLRGDEIEDCRDIFPEEREDCECTVCVSPESHADGTLTIQDGVERVRETGGKICLAPGIYEIRRPVRIRGVRGVQLVGKGSRSVIAHQGRGPAIYVDESYDVTIESLAIASASSGLGRALLDRAEDERAREGRSRRRRRKRRKFRAPEIGVLLQRTVGTRIEHCVLAQSESLYKRPPSLREEAEFDERARSRRLGDDLADRYGTVGSIGIALAGMVIETRIRDNVVFAETGVGLLAIGKTPAPPKPDGRLGEYMATDATAEAADMYGTNERRLRETGEGEERTMEYAIRAEGGGETALRRAETEVEDTATMLREPAGITRLSRYLVTLRLLIEDNVFVGLRAGVDLMSFGGFARTTSLVVHAGETRIAGNSIYRSRVGIALTGIVPGAGLAQRERDGSSFSSEERLTIGAAGIGGVDGSRVEIAGNTCALVALGAIVGCDGARIDNNLFTGVGSFRASGIMLMPSLYGGYKTRYVGAMSEFATGYYGILVGAEIHGNRISGFASFGIDSGMFGGFLVACEIADNRIDSCGTGGIQVAQAHGIGIRDNHIRDVGGGADDYAIGAALIRGSDSSRITGNVIAGVGPGAEEGGSCIGVGNGRATSLRIAGNHISSIASSMGGQSSGIQIMQGADRVDVVDNVVLAPDDGDTGRDYAAVRIESGSPIEASELTLLIRGNQLEAAGSAACVSLASAPGTANCTLADNQCRLTTGAEAVPVAVVEMGFWERLILSSNHVEGSREVLGIVAESELYTVLGNVATTGIEINGSLSAPWDQLNIVH
jgi:hypothetical protein